MYNFTIADVSDWNHYVYKTGETMRVDNNKIDLKVTKTLDNAPDDLDLSTIKFTVVVSEGEGDAAKTKTYTKTLAEIKAGADSGSRWYSYDSAAKTYTWYFTDLTSDSSAVVTETIDSTDPAAVPSSITYSILNDGTATVSEKNYTSGTNLTVTGLANDSIKTVSFTNSYSGTVDVTPVAYKKLDYKSVGTGSNETFPLDGLAFDFSLYIIPEGFYTSNHLTPMTTAFLTDSGNWNTTAASTSTASDSTKGKMTFDKITYSLGGAAVFPQYYYYKIKENTSGYDKITDDTGYVIMTVVINKDLDTGALTKSVTYTKYNADGTVAVAATTDPKAVAFNNTSDDTTLELKANKLLTENGKNVTPGNVFSFEPVALNGITDDQTNANQASVTNSAGNITFAALTYKGEDISTDSSNPTVYRYKISENTAPAGYTTDTNYYYVDVTVTRDTTTGGVKTSTKITKYKADGTVIEENVAASKIDFNDEKAARTGTIGLSVYKEVDGSIVGVDGNTYGTKFNFLCVYLGEQSNSLKPDEITSSTPFASAPKEAFLAADSNIITFPDITYSTAKGANTEFGTGKHIYKIYEGTSGYSGITSTQDYYVVVVSVVDPGSGTTLTPTIDKVYKYAYDSTAGTWGSAQLVPGGTSNVIFDNTTNQFKLPLNATKIIANGTYPKDGFEFEIKAIDNTGTGGKYYKSGTADETVITDTSGNAKFTDLVFKAGDEGTYQFEVTEKAGSDASVIYDTSVYIVTVNVTINSSTKAVNAVVSLVQKKDSPSDPDLTTVATKRIEFTNTLKPTEGSVTFAAKKKLKKAGETDASSVITDNDGNLKEFSFTLQEVNASGTPVISGVNQTKQNTINGAISFDAIPYADTDIGTTRYYKISEVVETTPDGYIYSGAEYYVKVDLTLDAVNNRVAATPTYYNNVSMTSAYEVQASDVVFINEERESVLNLEAHKNLVGADLSDYNGTTDGFEFTATRNGKTYKGYNDASGNVVISIDEVFSIDDVVKTNAVLPGPYEYVIKETSKTGFICDTNEYVAKVVFNYTAGGIEPTVTYYKSTDLVNPISAADVKFKNTKEATQEINITALKTFGVGQDEPGTNRIFSFGLYQDGGATPIQIKQNEADGKVTFDKIVFDQSVFGDANTKNITYTVKELVPSPTPLPGYIYDPTEYTIEVTLTRNSTTGEIDVLHTITKSGSSDTQSGTNIIGYDSSNGEFIKFNNDYDGTTKWPLSVRKVLSGNEDINLPFTFILEKYTNSDFTTVEHTYEATSDNTGYAVFDETETQIMGTPGLEEHFYYILKEKNTGDSLVSYSSEEIKLDVIADEENKITVKKYGTDEVYEESRVSFTNTIKIKVKKTDTIGNELDGAELQVWSNDAVVNTSGGNDKTNGITDNAYTGITIGQEYELREIKAPVGYANVDSVKFRVVYDSVNKKYVLQTHNGTDYVDVTGTGDELFTVVMQDETNSLIINKKISDTTFLEGATLQVKDAADTVFETAWTTDIMGGTNQNHSIDLSRLTPGEWYTLEETNAPFGYEIAEPVQFMIDTDNKVWSKKQSEAVTDAIELTNVDGKYTLAMFDEPLKLTITKYNRATNDKLPGAVFSIYAKDGSGLVQSGIEVSSAGTISLNVLTLGLTADKEYILEETTPPDGFEITDPITFKITSDNVLVVDGTNMPDTEIEVYDRAEGTIYISKVDPDRLGVELEGAYLGIYKDGKLVESYHSGSQPHEIRTGDLDKNKIYILKEIEAPKSAGVPTHYISAEIKFYIDNNSDLHVQKADEADYSLVGDGMIVMEDKARDVVKISKIDLVSSDELPNAKLKITDEHGNPVYEKTVDEHGNLTTTTNKLEHTTDGSKWEIDYSTFELGTPYVLTEITAPDGYEVAEDITFMIVNEGGQNVIKIKQTDGSYLPNTNMTVIMQDAPMNYVSFVKIDKSSGQTLAGAELTIYDSYGNVATSFTTTKDAKSYRVDDFNVNEEYTLSETGVPDGFYKADDVVFRVSFVTTENGRIRKLFVRDTDGTFKVRETGQIVVEDERIYKVKISKIDLTSEEEVPGAHIQIIDEFGSVVTEWNSTNTPTEIEGLRPNVTYTLRETVAPQGYKITTDTTFALKSDATIDYDKTTTAISSEGVLLVKDDITSLNFTKYGLIYESCGTDPAAYEPLEGVEFAAYAIDNDGNVSDTPAATATSSKNGIVLFTKLAKGKYQIRETKSVGTFKISKDYFYATVDDNNFAGLTDKEGNKIEGNRIVDDQYRTDIIFTKVSEKDKAKKLANSTYGLYRKNSLDEEILVATTVSDENGVVKFEGVLVDTKYVIRELKSPNGFYVSQNPIEISFKLDAEEVVLDSFNDGKGTALLAANGEITWLEPAVVVSFLKVDENGNPLPGATLAIADKNGNVVKNEAGQELVWVSTSTAVEVSDVLVIGETYQLVELTAPDGYKVADPVKFEIPDDKVETGENKVVSVVMKDEILVIPPESVVTPPTEISTPPAEVTTPPSVQTGDNTPVKPVTFIMLLSLAGIITLFVLGRKHKKIFK